MKKLFILIVLSGLFAFQSDNLIPWKEGSLVSWADFKGTADASSPYQANTETEVKVDVKTKGNQALMTIQCYFNKNLSWVKKPTDYLLTHEQMHFNITEISTRKFRQRLSGKTFPLNEFQQVLNTTHAAIRKESKEMQAQYDKETEHSVNEAAQKKWNAKITKELNDLKAFASPQITCTLKK
jgi:hypothetical protein